jgi:DNA-binding NarL/FixJ family response regulator
MWAVHGRSDQSTRPKLSRRELEVLKALTLEYTNLQAASMLDVSVKSVETYRLRLYRKLHPRSRAGRGFFDRIAYEGRYS